ncbi:MAG: glycosyltransferase family 2 protein, partial [Thermodesulfobacteriota bacterium]|nr:glycosyltransferase family 2 protein [Thermodesulfobacteriota bacterium]
MRSDLYPKAFKLVIPCHNCRDYIAQCLASIRDQTFADWTAVVADDASDDGTVDRIKPFLKDSRFSLRSAPKRLHLMGNTLSALRSLDIRPNHVAAIVDGDDYLLPEALEKLWERHRQGFDLVYTDEEIQGNNHSVGRAPLQRIPVRRQLWCFSMLRSFKGYLFNLLDDQTFKDEKGNYFRAAGDLSLFLPMAELAGMGKIKFIDEKLYYYRVHDRCNFKV